MKPFSQNRKQSIRTVVKAYAVFIEQTTIETSESSSERPPAAPSQATGGEARERLRPSRPVGPSIVSVRQSDNVIRLPSRLKTG